MVFKTQRKFNLGCILHGFCTQQKVFLHWYTLSFNPSYESPKCKMFPGNRWQLLTWLEHCLPVISGHYHCLYTAFQVSTKFRFPEGKDLLLRIQNHINHEPTKHSKKSHIRSSLPPGWYWDLTCLFSSCVYVPRSLFLSVSCQKHYPG